MKNKNEKGQIIVLTGVVLSVAVVAVAVISADLANIGVGTLRVHSKGLIPEFASLRSRFGEILDSNINEYEDMEYSFNKTYRDLYLIEIQYGNFFNATLNNYRTSGNVIAMFEDSEDLSHGEVIYVNATLSLDDGISSVTETVFYQILYTERR